MPTQTEIIESTGFVEAFKECFEGIVQNPLLSKSQKLQSKQLTDLCFDSVSPFIFRKAVPVITITLDDDSEFREIEVSNDGLTIDTKDFLGLKFYTSILKDFLNEPLNLCLFPGHLLELPDVLKICFSEGRVSSVFSFHASALFPSLFFGDSLALLAFSYLSANFLLAGWVKRSPLLSHFLRMFRTFPASVPFGDFLSYCSKMWNHLFLEGRVSPTSLVFFRHPFASVFHPQAPKLFPSMYKSIIEDLIQSSGIFPWPKDFLWKNK